MLQLALPLQPGSQALIGPERLAAMKPGAWLVNTARGAIVDRDALVESVTSGYLGGYAGDTWYPQSAPADHLWRTMPRHAMTIHRSGMAQQRITAGVREVLDAHLRGEPLPEDFVVVAWSRGVHSLGGRVGPDPLYGGGPRPCYQDCVDHGSGGARGARSGGDPGEGGGTRGGLSWRRFRRCSTARGSTSRRTRCGRRVRRSGCGCRRAVRSGRSPAAR
ncbi:hypothetical protein GCM10023222_28740 [Saccharopolyspora cebuensis]